MLNRVPQGYKGDGSRVAGGAVADAMGFRRAGVGRGDADQAIDVADLNRSPNTGCLENEEIVHPVVFREIVLFF